MHWPEVQAVHGVLVFSPRLTSIIPDSYPAASFQIVPDSPSMKTFTTFSMCVISVVHGVVKFLVSQKTQIMVSAEMEDDANTKMCFCCRG
jgi:hypothetical protein